MPDIQSTSAPNLSTSAAAAITPTTQLTAIQVAINSMSQSLQDLTHAIQTNATPVALSNTGNLTLATALGNITVALPQLGEVAQQDLLQTLMNMVQTQKPLTLSLQPVPPPTQATLILPTPASTIGTAAPSTQTLALSNIVQTQQSLSLPLIVKGDVLPAIVLPTTTALPQATTLPATQTYAPPLPSNLQAASAAPTNVPPSQQTPQNVLAPAPAITSVPAADVQEAIPTALPPAFLPIATQINAPPTQVQQLAAPLAALLQPGNEISLQVNSVLLPSMNPATVPLAPNQIVATVTGSTPDGKLILQAGNATLFVKSSVTAPPGTNLVVTVEATKSSPLTLLPLPQTQNFQSLAQAIATIAQSNPQILQQVLAHLPQPNELLPSTLLLLFGAFKQGDVRNWLGNNAAESLAAAGKEDILASLSHELSNAGQNVQDSVVGEWKSYPIPLYAQQQFQALTLYVHDNQDRQQKNDSSDSADSKKIRFVIDMRLSKLGAIQLDGFVQTKKLDMILRSEAMLPTGLHNELRQSYINAMGAVGYTGTLNFQVGRHYWLNIRQQAPRGIVT